MTTATQHKPEPNHINDPTVQTVTEAMQRGLTTWLTVPQRLIQANAETISESVRFFDRRIKAQAAMLSRLGEMANGGSMADAQKHLIETMTRELADEVQEVGELARKNLETAMRLTAGGASGARSS